MQNIVAAARGQAFGPGGAVVPAAYQILPAAFKLAKAYITNEYMGRQQPAKFYSKRRSTNNGKIVKGRTRAVGNYGRYYGASAMSGGGGRERKFLDTADLSNTSTTAGVIATEQLVILIGTAPTERIGRKVFIKQIDIRFFVSLSSSTTLASGSVRFIVGIDKQANGAQPTVQNLLSIANVNSYYNLINQGRYTILKDKVVTINRIAGSENATDVYPEVTRRFTFHKKCNIPIEYSGATGAVTEIRSNNLFILVIGDNTLTDWEARTRVRYTD